MLVFSFAPRGFSPGTPISPARQKLTFLNSNSTRNGRNRTLCRCAYSKWYKQTNEQNIAELPLNRYLFGRHNKFCKADRPTWKLTLHTPLESKTERGCSSRQLFCHESSGRRSNNPGGGATWVFFGWVCAARDSKLAPRSKKKFP